MDNDKLEKAIALYNQIEELEKLLNIWEKSVSISTINVTFTNMYNGISSENLKSDYIDFDVLKVLTVNSIKKRLQELKTEYENL